MKGKKISRKIAGLNFIKTLKIIWRIKPSYVFITIVVTFLNSLYPAVSLIIMQRILNTVYAGNVKIKEVFLYLAIYIGIDLVQTIILAMAGYFTGKYTLVINLYIKNEVLKKASYLTLKEYEDSEIYNIIQRAQNESENKVTTYFALVISIFGGIITVCSYLVLLLSFEIWMVFFVLLIPVIKFHIQKRINIKQFNILFSRTAEERKTWYYSYLITNGIYTQEMHLYKLYDLFLNKFKSNREIFIKQDIEILKESTKKMTLLSLVEQILDGGMFAYIVYNGIMGLILLGDVVTYTRSVVQVKSKIQTELNSFAEIEKQSLYLEQLFFLLEREVNQKNNAEKKIETIENIKVVNLKYRYKENGNYVLNNLNFELKKGKTYAILGRNGSGKTTLVKILMGFYDDYEGEIFVNGINLRYIEKECYRSRIGSLFQDYGKYETTIRENIAFGNLDLLNDDEAIKAIAQEVEISSFIDKQKKGLDTQLGYWFDDGMQISTGQWQKIALCRAFTRNADMYIFDEPNASLDAISGYDIEKSYKRILKEKLGIIIAHKFGNFICEIDNIFVMESGEIVESGSHEELLEKNGVYKKLYELQ